jgi:hypothetical protein
LRCPEDRLVLSTVTLVALPIIGTALTNIPTIGANLNAIALNIQMALAGSLATSVAIRIYHMTMDGVTGLAGGNGSRTAAAAAR